MSPSRGDGRGEVGEGQAVVGDALAAQQDVGVAGLQRRVEVRPVAVDELRFAAQAPGQGISQLRGEAGDRQVADARVGVVSSGGLTPSGVLLLRADA